MQDSSKMPDSNEKGLLSLASKPFEIWMLYAGNSYGFPVRLYLSEEWNNRREASIGTTPEEKAILLRDFKTEIVCDVLAGEPINVPDFPPTRLEAADPTPQMRRQDLYERAKDYFGAKDGQGNQILWFVVEYIFREYWERALPGSFPTKVADSVPAANLPQQ